MTGEQQEDDQATVSRLCRDATFHTIRGLSQINDQSQRLWIEFDAHDCHYHLGVAIGYLQQIAAIVTRSKQ